MSDPTTPAEVREAIRGNKRLEHLVVMQVRMQRLKAHERDTAEHGTRLYDDDLFPDAVDMVKAHRAALEIIEMNPEE